MCAFIISHRCHVVLTYDFTSNEDIKRRVLPVLRLPNISPHNCFHAQLSHRHFLWCNRDFSAKSGVSAIDPILSQDVPEEFSPSSPSPHSFSTYHDHCRYPTNFRCTPHRRPLRCCVCLLLHFLIEDLIIITLKVWLEPWPCRSSSTSNCTLRILRS